MTPEEQKLLLLQGGKAIKNQEDTNKILKELSDKPAPIVNIHPEIKIPEIKIPDNKDLIEALSKIENKIQVAEKLEIADYTEQLKGIAERIEKIQPTDLSKLEGLLKNISETLNREPEKSKVFDEVSSKNPLPIMVIGGDGKRVTNFGGELTAPSIVGLRVGTTAVGADNPLPTTVDGFAIPMFDTQVIDETDPDNVTIVYKRSGVIVATKTISISGSVTT